MAEPSKRDIEKWIKALRSGKFKQGVGRLQSNAGLCCLGVACKINRFRKALRADGFLAGSLPEEVQPHAPAWLQNINDQFAAEAGPLLSQLNDGYNGEVYNFDEIADLLQAVYIEGALDGQ